VTRILVTEEVDPAGLERLSSQFEVSVVLTQDPEQIRREIATADAVLVKGSTQLTAKILASAPQLKAIARVGNGLDNIDLDYARRRQIAVFNTPEGATQAVAEFTVLQMLALCRRAYEIHRGWLASDYRRARYVGCELRHRTVGIVGFGRIGHAVGRLLAPFGCRRYAWDVERSALERAQVLGIQPVDHIDALMEACDVVTLHVPLTTATRGMIDARRLRLMPEGSLLLNIARGGILDERALLEAIQADRIAGAAIDVLAHEPSYDATPDRQDYTDPLLDEPAVILTPHVGASTVEAQRAMSCEIAEQLIRFLSHLIPVPQ
jgi:D-3-phosphoglycerate dehydrogenase